MEMAEMIGLPVVQEMIQYMVEMAKIISLVD